MSQTLLLVDDSVTIQRVIQLTFADEQIRVVTAGTIDQALELVRQSPPDVVLADVGMPGQNGFDLARALRSAPATADVPVLLLTGAFEPVDPERARAVGANGVLVKPFEPAVVINRVRELIGASASGGAATPSLDPQASSALALPATALPMAAAGALPAVAEPPARTEKMAQLDDYFAQLDQAIARGVSDPQPVRPEPAVDAAMGSPSGEAPASALPGAAPAPLLSGAFSALLAAEQRGSADDAFDGWLPEPPPPAPPPVLTAASIADDLVEAIVARVIQRLPDAVVRDAVREIANSTAERMVREEIERIKNDVA